MVNFREVVSAVAENAHASFQIPFLNMKSQTSIELYPLPPLQDEVAPALVIAPEKTVAISSVTAANAAVVPRQSKRSLPAPTPATALAAAPTPTPAPATALAAAPPALEIRTEDTEDEYTAPLPPPTRAVSVSVAPVVTKHSESSVTPEAPAERATTETVGPNTVIAARAKGYVLDPICIGINVRDPMYAIATAAVKQSIECEEARVLEGRLDELYKSESGRSRGWTKTHLTEFIVPRAAAGSKVSFKQAFDWSLLRTDKHTAAALDFVCLAKGIRLAVWFEDTHEIGIWPAADPNNMAGRPQLFHISGTGQSVGTPKTVVADGWTIRAAPSVENSLEKLSLSELDNLAEQIGLPGLTGKKTDRVRAIASFRTRQRLGI